MTFDADAILYGGTRRKKMDISMFKRCLQYDFGWNQVKYARIRPLFFIFTLFLQIFPVFSSGRDQLLERAGQENISSRISPRISPLHEFWIAGLDSSI